MIEAKTRAEWLSKIKKDGYNLKEADTSIKQDKEIVLAAVKHNGIYLEYADDSLKKDKEVVLVAVKNSKFDDHPSGRALSYADISLKKDKEIVLAAVTNDVRALQYADASLTKDKSFVLLAVKIQGIALEYIDNSLNKDKEIVLAAIKQDGNALQYADGNLQKAKEFVFIAFANMDITSYGAEPILKKIQNQIWLKELFKRLASNTNYSTNFNLCYELANSIYTYLEDKIWSNKLYEKSVNLAQEPEHYRELFETFSTKLSQATRAEEFKKKGFYKINETNNNWGYGSFVYFFIGEIDFFAVNTLVEYVFTDTTTDEEGEEVIDFSEYDPSIIYTDTAGELEDDYTFSQLINKTKLKDIKGTDLEKLELLMKELQERDVNLVLINTKIDYGLSITNLKIENFLKILEKYKSNLDVLNIYIREYDHAEDY